MISFVPLDEGHIPELQAWFTQYSDKWLGHADYPGELLALKEKSSNRHCFIALEDSRAVAIVDLEIEDDRSAWMSLIVRPDARGKGMGKMILRAFLEESVLKGVDELKIEIEKDNEASLRCFRAVGFQEEDRADTTEGFVFLSMRLNRGE